MMRGQDSNLKLTNRQDVLFSNFNNSEGCFIITTGIKSRFLSIFITQTILCQANY